MSSCDFSGDLGYCVDLEIGAPAQEALNNCLGVYLTDGYEGILNDTSSCPTASRIGTCAFVPASGAPTKFRYYSPTYTVEKAKTNCELQSFGKFTAE